MLRRSSLHGLSCSNGHNVCGGVGWVVKPCLPSPPRPWRVLVRLVPNRGCGWGVPGRMMEGLPSCVLSDIAAMAGGELDEAEEAAKTSPAAGVRSRETVGWPAEGLRSLATTPPLAAPACVAVAKASRLDAQPSLLQLSGAVHCGRGVVATPLNSYRSNPAMPQLRA